MARLFQTFTGLWGDLVSVEEQEVGNAFTVAVDTPVLAVGWYRSTTGTTYPSPDYVNVWRASDAARIIHAVAADDHTIAWQWTNLDTPVVLSAGVVYVVSYHGPSGWQRANGFTGAAPTPPSPFNWSGSPPGRYNGGGASSYPSGANSNPGYFAVDVSTDEAGSPGGTGGTTTTGDLQSWFSNLSDVNAHKSDGIPWQEKLARDALTSGLGSAITGLYKRLDDGVDWLRDHVDALPDAIQDKVDALLATLEDRFTAINDAIASVQAQLDAADAARSAQTATIISTLGGRVALGDPSWVLQDETDFEGEIAWAVPADIYVVSFDPGEKNHGVVSVAGVPWTPRAGWWSVLNGTQAGDRAFIEFPEQQLGRGDVRMPGVLVQLLKGDTGHIQAWTKP